MAMMLDKQKDGTLLDGHGQPLPPGRPPVYLPFEVYDDVDFNDLNFGEFIEEVEVGGIPHISRDEVFRLAKESRQFSSTMKSGFVAPSGSGSKRRS